MRKLFILVMLVAVFAGAQTIEITDTLATRMLYTAGTGMCKLSDYVYVAQGNWGIRIYRVSGPSIVETGEYIYGSDWGENVIDLDAYSDPYGGNMMVALFNTPAKLLQFFEVTSPTVLTPIKVITPPASNIIGNNLWFGNGWILASVLINTGDKGGLYLLDGHNPTTTAIVDEWWPSGDIIVSDAIIVKTGRPGWIAAALWDKAGDGANNEIKVFKFYHEYGILTATSISLALPSTAEPGEMVTGWMNSDYDICFYLALGPDGVGAYKISYEDGSISEIDTWTSPNVSDIKSIARWGNRLYCADHCTTHSADAYALHIVALDTLTMGFDTTVTPVSLHGRLGRDVCADSSEVWIIADVPKGSDESSGAR